MTRYHYECEADKKLIKKSYENIALLIFGKDKGKISHFTKYYNTKVSQINVYPQWHKFYGYPNSVAGKCELDDDGNIIIEMRGYKGAGPEKYSWLKHEGTHEFCHSFIDLLPQIMQEDHNGLIENGFLYKNFNGGIIKTDVRTDEMVGQNYFGIMYNETMTDIMTSMAVNCFDSNGPTSTVDEILINNVNDWGNEKTAYSIFTSITRLTIAAFSNRGNVNYQTVVDHGYGIFDLTTKMKNGEIYKLNDFLYGMVFDHLHIKKEFDKFMGEGSYITFCKYLDQLFNASLEKQKLPSDKVKKIMKILPDFLNKKMSYYIRNGLIEQGEANLIVSKFNLIWNTMQQEYSSYFTSQDIEEIAKRARKNNN